jgi:uncharacterized zinc-type alcohol dehydrogenase-like protein
MTIRAYAVHAPRAALSPFEFDPGPLADEDVEIAVEHCGICHSDLSMIDNEWQRTQYPLVAGHEVVGTVRATGLGVKRVAVGDRVGVGWYCGSCLECRACTAGDLHLCVAGRQTIVGNHGGFAEALRCHWSWALPLPEGLQPALAGPLFCGGITVFTPIVEFGVAPTDRVGVVGLGGLGHLALQFLNRWGCEVFAFSSTPAKSAEAQSLGAHHVIGTHDKAALKSLRGALDFVLVTSNVTLDWPAYLAALAPKGRLHVVGAVLDPIPVQAFGLIGGQKSVSGSPVGSPATTLRMLDFCVRHGIAPRVERYPMSRINDAFAHLRAGKARYRIVLDADFR